MTALKVRRARMFARGMSVKDVAAKEGATRQGIVAYIQRNFVDYPCSVDVVRDACRAFLNGETYTPEVKKDAEVELVETPAPVDLPYKVKAKILRHKHTAMILTQRGQTVKANEYIEMAERLYAEHAATKQEREKT